MNNIVQFVIEFHYTESLGGLMVLDNIKLFDKLNETHILVHLHANNNDKVIEFRDITIPKVFESTYINKKYIKTNLKLNTDNNPSN